MRGLTGKRPPWLADDPVLVEPVSDPEFPENREIYREFLSFGRFSAIFVPNRRANSAVYNKSPYVMEQGIFFGRTGNFFAGTGKSF
jgi:hypothetical protein